MKYVVDVNGERVVVDLDGVDATVDGVRYEVALTPVDGTPVRLVRGAFHVVHPEQDVCRRERAVDRDRLGKNGGCSVEEDRPGACTAVLDRRCGDRAADLTGDSHAGREAVPAGHTWSRQSGQ